MTSEKENSKSTSKKDKNNRLKGIAGFSLLIALFDRLGLLIYDTFINGFFGTILTSYTKLNQKLSSGFFGRYFFHNPKITNFFRRIQRFFASRLESCVTISLTASAIEKLCSFPLQYYGNFGLFFGIYAVVIYYVKLFIPWLEASPSSHLWAGIIVTITSIPLLFSRINLANSVKNSVFGRGLFKSAFGFSDELFDNKKSTSRGKGNIMLFLGLLTGISTLFIHPLVIIIAIVTSVIITLIACSPEIGVLLTIFVLPFLSLTSSPTIWLGIMVLITTFFYVIKLIRGKRVFQLEILDLAILLFGILILLSSVFSAGGNASAYSAIISFILLLGYFLLVNLMRTVKWIKRCIFALVTSSVIVSVIGIFEFLFGAENNNWLDQSFYGIIKTRVVSLFENPNILSVFLVMIFPFLLALLVRAREKNDKFLIRTLIILSIVCIIFTWSRAAWIAIIFGTLLFSMLYTKKSFRIFGAILIILPLIPILLPSSIIERFLSISNLSDSSIAYRIYTWKGTLGAIKDYFFFGIGYGDSSFQAIYPSYAYSGIEATPHSHSLLLQILLCMGIVGFVVLCIAIFLNFQKSFEYIKQEKDSASTVYVIAAVVSIVSALIMGVFDYIWYNPRMFYLFWTIIAIGTAFVRVGSSERMRLESFQHDQPI
jgi:O-antigen ligase